MTKVVDIDQFLQERAVTIKLNGKEFTVKDVSEETRKLMDQQDDSSNHKEIVKSLLGCTDDDLKGYGLAAFTHIVNEVTRNLFPSSSQEDQSSG